MNNRIPLGKLTILSGYSEVPEAFYRRTMMLAKNKNRLLARISPHQELLKALTEKLDIIRIEPSSIIATKLENAIISLSLKEVTGYMEYEQVLGITKSTYPDIHNMLEAGNLLPEDLEELVNQIIWQTGPLSLSGGFK